MNKTIIFDLDGTLANIDVRRDKSLKPNGKLNWDIFASPTSIMDWDTPNVPVIKMAQLFKNDGFKVLIKKEGWSIVVIFFLFYLVRDSILYIIIPYIGISGLSSCF